MYLSFILSPRAENHLTTPGPKIQRLIISLAPIEVVVLNLEKRIVVDGKAAEETLSDEIATTEYDIVGGEYVG